MSYDSSPWSGTISAGAHRICTCGESANKPYCDGAHSSASNDKTPVLFKVEEEKKVALCMCGKSLNSPLCDGSHTKP
jgi:CDGSH-type Zn-finger protein